MKIVGKVALTLAALAAVGALVATQAPRVTKIGR